MKLWLDDVRKAPSGWMWAKNVGQAMQIIQAFVDSHLEWEAASFDHDLGNDPGGDAVKLVLWMAENDIWPEHRPAVHSMNPVGRDNLLALIHRYGPYDYLSRKVTA